MGGYSVVCNCYITELNGFKLWEDKVKHYTNRVLMVVELSTNGVITFSFPRMDTGLKG